ncbi:hypothetical protein JTE90_016096 [Oedothorax gibbosus]|uniref:Uncharacterized protein n=1 Tax=Oedothorax gibbosus TaxID=931172 RepID=A0AAV6TR66_9ARAC|nr:hypothetical protein JTE90_016096 [Oedothorax gibbosus]
MEPFSSFSPQGSHLSICYYHQDLHRWRLHRDPPTHCGVNLHKGSSAVAVQGGLLTHLKFENRLRSFRPQGL